MGQLRVPPASARALALPSNEEHPPGSCSSVRLARCALTSTPIGPVPQDVSEEDDQFSKRGDVGDAAGRDVLNSTDQVPRQSGAGIEVQDECAIGREIEHAAVAEAAPPP